MKARFRRAAPVSVSRTGCSPTLTSMATGNRALLPSTPSVSAAVAAPMATATVTAAVRDRVQVRYGIVPPVEVGVIGGPPANMAGIGGLVQPQYRPPGKRERPVRRWIRRLAV